MLDVMNYAVHLAAADGNISQEERTKIAELFGYSLSEKEWIEYLRKRNLLSEDYRKNVPYTYVQVVEAENTLRATKQDYSPSKEFVTLYNMVANLILQKSPTSGVAHQQKENYLNNMKRYAAKRLTLPWCTVEPIAEQPPTVVHKESVKKKKNAATGYSKSIIIHIDNKPIAISVYSNIFTIDGDVILPSGDNGPAVYSPTNSGPKIVNVNKDGLVWNVPQPSQSKKTGARTEPSLNKKIDKSQIDSLLSELNALVGLESVKKDVHGLIHMQEAQRKQLPAVHSQITGNMDQGEQHHAAHIGPEGALVIHSPEDQPPEQQFLGDRGQKYGSNGHEGQILLHHGADGVVVDVPELRKPAQNVRKDQVAQHHAAK